MYTTTCCMPYSLLPGTSKSRSRLFFNTVPCKKILSIMSVLMIEYKYNDHATIILQIIGGGGVFKYDRLYIITPWIIKGVNGNSSIITTTMNSKSRKFLASTCMNCMSHSWRRLGPISSSLLGKRYLFFFIIIVVTRWPWLERRFKCHTKIPFHTTGKHNAH